MRPPLRPSSLPPWPAAFDTSVELDWGDPEFARRLLREHLDQSHDGASRRRTVRAGHARRLRHLLPAPPAPILDAGSGPGLYAVPLAVLGYRVTGVDVSAVALRHARDLARAARLQRTARFVRGDLRDMPLPDGGFDAALLIYFVLESFSRIEQPAVLARIAAALAPGGVLGAELRLRPPQPPARLCDSVSDPRRHPYVLRDVAVFDDGTVSVRQTSGWLCPFGSIPRLFKRAGVGSVAMYDGWTGAHASTRSHR